MIVSNKDNHEDELRFLRDHSLVKNVLSVQDVIDMLSSLKPPAERSLNNIPFGIIGKNGKAQILYGDSKENRLIVALNKALPILLNFKENTGIIISDKDALYKELDSLRKENSELKDKLSQIKSLIDNNKDA